MNKERLKYIKQREEKENYQKKVIREFIKFLFEDNETINSISIIVSSKQSSSKANFGKIVNGLYFTRKDIKTREEKANYGNSALPEDEINNKEVEK